MIIQIDKLIVKERKSLDFTENYNIPDVYGVTDSDVSARFVGNISLNDDLFTLKGTLNISLSICCSLCLTPVSVDLEIDILEKFKNSNNNENADSFDEDINYFNSLEIDTHQSLLENILLNIPVKVYCMEDCKGLCSYCGATLNTTTCSCEKPVDPRLASLMSYFDDVKE